MTAFQLGPVVLSAPRFYAGLALLVLVVVAELAAWGGRRAARAGEAVEATPAARRDGGEPAAGPGATAARGSTDEAPAREPRDAGWAWARCDQGWAEFLPGDARTGDARTDDVVAEPAGGDPATGGRDAVTAA